MIQTILNKAKELGACRLADGVNDWPSLARLLFSPQGREFCEANNFPSVPMWSEIKEHDVTRYGVYVDTPYTTVRGRHEVAVIGQSDVHVWCVGSQRAYTVIAQHGACITVHARDYAVVLIVCIGTNTINIDKDDSSIILW